MATGLMPRVQFTILARDKEPNMSMFFQCIENMDYDPKSIDIYAHTNNNSDRTGEMLKDWCNDNRNHFGNMHMVEEDIPELRDKPGRKSEADWYAQRFVKRVSSTLTLKIANTTLFVMLTTFSHQIRSSIV